ncbi:MAG: hypothetical protein H0T54_09835 [Geodermatophilaceae bacterium]|nr:hypothetical protein [Geodermatophilaceae bacterium]
MRKVGHKSRPVQWCQLIERIDDFTDETGQRLDNVWKLVHEERYEDALNLFERIVIADARKYLAASSARRPGPRTAERKS